MITPIDTNDISTSIKMIKDIFSSIKNNETNEQLLNPEINGMLYELNKWNFGRTPEFLNRKDYKPTAIFMFDNISEMWKVINNVFVLDDFIMKSNTVNEIWFFRFGYVPNTDEFPVKSKPTEITVKSPSKGLVLYFLMGLFGENLLKKSEDMEKIIGTRIKPSKFGGDFRLWIIDTDLVQSICHTLQNMIGEWNENCTVSSKILNY
jgi:hypothetical protein